MGIFAKIRDQLAEIPDLERSERGNTFQPFDHEEPLFRGKSPVLERQNVNNGRTSANIQNANASPENAPQMSWHEADRVYMMHHLSCTSCQAAGRGRGERCAAGSTLWAAYESIPAPLKAG